MKPKLESLLALLALCAVVAIPIVMVLSMVVHGKIISGKQVTMDRARASLLSALNEVKTLDGKDANLPKQYGYFVVSPFTNNVIVGGDNYQCALVTGELYQFATQGRLAVTTNRVFIWLDWRRGAKIIADGYKVSQWRTGY